MKKLNKLIALGAAAVMLASPSMNLVAATEVTNSGQEVVGEDGTQASTGEAEAAGSGYQAGASAPLVGAQALAGVALAAGIAALALTNSSSSGHGHGHSH